DMNESGGRDGRRFTSSRERDVVVLQRERSDTLAGRREDCVEHCGCGGADRRVADAPPEAPGWHDDRLDLRPLGQKIETVEKTVSFPFLAWPRGVAQARIFWESRIGWRGGRMDWARILAYVTGTVDQELLARIEYLAAENRILKAQLKGRLKLLDAERAMLAEIGHRLGRKVLAEVATVARPDTILAWYRKLVARKFDCWKARRMPG